MNIEIHSDVVCPWCYIGLSRFDAALRDYPGREDVTVEHRPFQLDPEASREPVPHLQAYAAKLGDPDRVASSVAELESAAAELGLPLHLEQAQRVNTFDAHRLIALAAEPSSGSEQAPGGPHLQHETITRLMHAYFAEGRNLADHGELAAVAKEAGLTGVDVSAYLASDAGSAVVREQVGEGRALGVDSVPTFVFEQRWAVSGAQSAETMGQVLAQIETAMLGGGGGGCCGGGGGGCACSA
ncbi:MAG: DsbA family oxidoreductase [Geodermatophilaceae bacterium]|nr:DsbA family oxidoreductase [Geodermatophilaceae bacterium]